MDDSLHLEVADFEHDVLTGIYSEETGKPQPLRHFAQQGERFCVDPFSQLPAIDRQLGAPDRQDASVRAGPRRR